MTSSAKILVLGLGNELLSDDAVGILAARALKEKLGERADVVESALSGMALLEFLVGYEKAIVIDAVKTGKGPPGTIYELSPSDLSAVLAPSPHYAGLPELIATAQALQLDFPKEIEIFAIEVEDPYTIGEKLSPAVAHALPKLIQRVEEQVACWLAPSPHA